MDEPFYSFATFLKSKFPGGKVWKIPIDAGFSCPNRDGTLSGAGCIFCDPFAAGPVATAGWTIEEQITAYVRRHPGQRFIAYFQAHCNTYGPVADLRRKYETVFRFPEIVGLFVGTRPDELPEPVLSLLQETGRRIYLSVELGLQSVHERSLNLLNRNHTVGQFESAFHELRRRSIDCVIHLIIGIPGETRADMRATIEVMNALKPAGIKFHPLHVLRGSPLQAQHARGSLPLLGRDEYIDIICDLLEHLDPDIVVHRLTADREKELFIAPLWALKKAVVLEAIRREMRQRGSRQGCRRGID
jgi:radical SAM protein (TIGR01212 family)